jgi:hypothetical protein
LCPGNIEMLNKDWTKLNHYCWFGILLYTLKLCVNSILINNDSIFQIDGYVKTPIKYRNIPKFHLLEINYFIMNCESIHNVIVDSVADFAEIIIGNY